MVINKFVNLFTIVLQYHQGRLDGRKIRQSSMIILWKGRWLKSDGKYSIVQLIIKLDGCQRQINGLRHFAIHVFDLDACRRQIKKLHGSLVDQ